MTRWLCLLLACGLSAQPPVTRHRVAGLQAPVELRIDRWGVPHIYAKRREDAFFAQGFNAARDRLWQIDLWRKRGLGLLSQDLGPDCLEQDRASRLFLYRGSLDAEWQAYGPETQATVKAFVAGINAYVGLVLSGKAPLPEEFQILHTRPAYWAPEEVVRVRSHGLFGNLPQEVARAQMICLGGKEAEAFRKRLEPTWEPMLPKGLDPCSIPSEVLRAYILAKADPLFPAPGRMIAQTDLVDAALALPRTASNTFAVSGARSATGRPILANDPHREYQVPSLRYLAHLVAPGMDVIGAGEPAMPGLSLGHNRHIAVGLTYCPLDQEDLYVYETKPGDPNQYRYGSGWEAFRVLSEPISVRGQGPRVAQLKFTRHGPVLYEDPDHRRAYALRAAWLEPGMVPYLSSLRYMRADGWKPFLEAMRQHGLPGLNYMYADTKGNIGLAPSGLFPKRSAWDGLLPVPGDGRYEWEGWQHGDRLPRWFNPAEGWLGSANEMNLPSDYPAQERRPAFEWGDPFRMQRIREVLSASRKVSIQDLQSLQNDHLSLPARRLVALLDPVPGQARDRVSEAVQRLKAWDGRVEADSAAAAIFEVWLHKYLRPAVVAKVLPERARGLAGDGDLSRIVGLMERPDARLGRDPLAARRDLLLASLAGAVKELEGRLGGNMGAWTWGQLHRIHLVHPLADRVDAVRQRRLNPETLPVGGSHETVGRASFRNGTFDLTAGASVRLVMDVGAWDNSTASNAPGQSGDPADPHYRDLLESWSRSQYFPLLYSRKAVEQATERIIWIEPKGTGSARKP
ncbi:penicillin amidase [Geothrix limicola]|uniref:Penicillin amidase n=1 Tax=Geothrix limicola TaxID=2927978 RepID=A0ABQ5QD84_9BACT|nr:penicillin acylase family protein [Geothrix limicola]GLH72529.1 penicillin amidase [Geothrix limicola]